MELPKDNFKTGLAASALMFLVTGLFLASLYVLSFVSPYVSCCTGIIFILSIFIVFPIPYILAIRFLFKGELKKAAILAISGMLWVLLIPSVLVVSSSQPGEFDNMDEASDCDFNPRQSSCLISVAYNTKNASICEENVLFKLDMNLRDRCYSNVALATDNATICSLINDRSDRDKCYSSYAFKTGDASACDNVESPWEKDDCEDSAGNSWIYNIMKNFLGQE